MNFSSYIRKLAKTSDMLNLFIASKELNGIRLFENETNFSQLQLMFINYLYYYHNLHQDISLKKVSEHVLDNEIYENAYSYYKSKNLDEIKPEDKKKPKKSRKFSGIFSKDNKLKFPNVEGN